MRERLPRPLLRSPLPAGSLLVLLLLAPLAGRADMIEIEFDLTGSSISALNGAVSIPPNGTINAASATLAVPGTGSVTASSGPASLRDFLLDVTVDAAVLENTITGAVVATQLSTALGTLTGALGHVSLTQSLFANATGFFDCSGSLCGFIGTFPATFNGTQTFPPPLGLGVSGLGTAGSAQVTGTLTFSLAGQAAVLSIVGAETSRTFVPEPSHLVQLAAAGVLVVLLFLRRSRR